MGSEATAGNTRLNCRENKTVLIGLILYSLFLVFSCLLFMEKKINPIAVPQGTVETLKHNITITENDQMKKSIRASALETNEKFMHVGPKLKEGMQPAKIKCEGDKLLLEIPVKNYSLDDVLIMLQNHPKLRKLLNDSDGNRTNETRTHLCESEEALLTQTSPVLSNEENVSRETNVSKEAHVDMSSRPTSLKYFISLRNKQPFKRRCQSCALVSSSGHMLGSGAGPEIDKHDCVIRMNNAPTKGFEKDVGTRSTVRVSCFISVKLISNESSKLLEGPGKPESVLMWGTEHKTNKKSLEIAKKLVPKYPGIDFFSHRMEGELEAEKVFERETGRNRKKTHSWLSTGWFTMLVTLDMCEKIHVYGMAPEDFCKIHSSKPIKYHYYQPKESPQECATYKGNELSIKGGHRFMTEKVVFARWGLKYNMSFHHPEWNVQDEATKALDTPFTNKFKKTSRK